MIEAFIKYITFEKRYAKNTLISYKNDLDQYEEFMISQFEIEKLEESKHLHIRSWIVNLMSAEVSPKSINRKISTLRSFFNYLRKKDKIEINPMHKVIAPKIAKRLPKYLTEENMLDISDLIEMDESFASYRNRLIVELFYNTGIRRSELIGLLDIDADTRNNSIKVLGKGNKERQIPITPALSKQIDAYRSKREEEFPEYTGAELFVTNKGKKLYPRYVYNVVHKIISKVSTMEQRSPHVLRHTFATHLTNSGAELNAIKELLGHANLSATQIYTHNSIARLKDVYKKAHPKSKS